MTTIERLLTLLLDCRRQIALAGHASAPLDTLVYDLGLVRRCVPVLACLPPEDIKLNSNRRTPARLIIDATGSVINQNQLMHLLDIELLLTADVLADVARCRQDGESVCRSTYIEVAPGRPMPAKLVYELLDRGEVLLSVEPIIG